MPQYAEVIFEPGSKSLLSYDREDEVRSFVTEHHRRAVNGEPGSAQDQAMRVDLSDKDLANMPSLDRMKSRPAERIVRVLLYSDNPIDSHPSRVSESTVKTLVEGMADSNNTIDHEQLTRALRDEVSPVYPQDQGRHKSQFKAEGVEMDLSFLADIGTTGGETSV